MFTYIFYVGGMTLIGAVACSILYMGFRAAPPVMQGTTGRTALATVCIAVMLGLPYAGYTHTVRSKDITRRNNEFAALETEIMKLKFDMQCTFNGHRTSARTSANNIFPCIQRDNIRIVSNPYRSGMLYFVIGESDVPVRWRGMVDYPIPFSFPQDRKLLPPEIVRRAFLSGNTPIPDNQETGE